MCGILFCLNKKKKFRKAEINNLKKSSKKIIHRGPDFQKTIIKDRLFMFHSRLKIQDINARSNQPMHFINKNEKFTLLYNGEIYNFKKLRKKINVGVEFKTLSDTEVFLKNYIHKKKKFDFVLDFEGMFSFVLMQKKNEIIFGRDFFGQKPLYFYDDKEKIIISSEIKPISYLIRKNQLNYNKEIIEDYFFKNDYFSGRDTFYKDIKQVLPGEIGLINNNNISFNRFYSFINYKKNKRIPKLKYLKFFEKNIINHTISDKKIALSLSSGLDSSAIAHVIYTFHKKKYNLMAYTFDFEGKEYEYEEAKNFVKSYKKEIKKSVITKNYLINNFEKLFVKNEGPIGGIGQFGLFKICEEAKKDGYDVMLSGYGLDESFGSYNSIRLQDQKENSFRLIDNSRVSNFKFKKEKNSPLLKSINDYFFKIKIPRTTHFVDRSSMASSIEMRIPFLEHNFVEKSIMWSNYNKKLDKYLIREYMQKNSKYKKNWLKPKIHAPHPQNEWLREGVFSEWTNDILKENFLYNKCDFLKKSN